MGRSFGADGLARRVVTSWKARKPVVCFASEVPSVFANAAGPQAGPHAASAVMTPLASLGDLALVSRHRRAHEKAGVSFVENVAKVPHCS